MARRERDFGYAYMVRCPECKGPLYLLSSGKRYWCADESCRPGGHLFGVNEVEEEAPQAKPRYVGAR